MPEYLRKFAELHEQGKTPEEIAEELGVSVTTVKQKYMYLYRKYIDEAAKLLADGAPEDVVMGELGITRKMMEEAAKKAFKRIQKQVEAIKKESESAQERIQKELQEAGVGGGAPSEVKGRYKELLEEIRSMKTVLDELAKYAVPPTPPSPRPPSPSAPSAPSTQQVLQPEIAKLREKLESLEKNIMQYIAAPYTGRIKKYVVYPDGRVDIEYDYHPNDEAKIIGVKTMADARKKQVDAMVDKVLPEVISELKETRKDISSIGERLLTILETYIVPKLPRLHPALESTLPVTWRTPEQREQELRRLEERLSK
ncbi:hypothetical protein DRN86_04170, partial [Candidatus Geothermarchaeota archaeon]